MQNDQHDSDKSRHDGGDVNAPGPHFQHLTFPCSWNWPSLCASRTAIFLSSLVTHGYGMSVGVAVGVLSNVGVLVTAGVHTGVGGASGVLVDVGVFVGGRCAHGVFGAVAGGVVS